MSGERTDPFKVIAVGKNLSTEGSVTSIFFNTLTDVVMLLSPLMHAVRHPLRHGLQKREGPATRRHPRKLWHLRNTTRGVFSLYCTTPQIKKKTKYRNIGSTYSQKRNKPTKKIKKSKPKHMNNSNVVISYVAYYMH